MRVSIFTLLKNCGGPLSLLAALAACQSPPESAGSQAPAAHPPVGHFAGTLTAAGRPELRAALEVRHPRPGHYDAELVVDGAPSLNFVADTLAFAAGRLLVKRPGLATQTLALTQQGDFWRGTLTVDSTSYPALLVRRGPPTPAIYRVRPDEVPGSPGQALLFSPADESLAGAALAVFPTAATASTSPAWADALARQGFTVLLLPAADTLDAHALTAALGYLRRTPGVDTARVGTWAAGHRAELLAALLATPAALPAAPAFVVAQGAPLPSASMRGTWRTLGQRTQVLGLYEATDATTTRAASGLQAALGGRRARIVRGSGPEAIIKVNDWLRER